MGNQKDNDAISRALKELNPHPQPVASSTPENSQSPTLRSSSRLREMRRPCYSEIAGRRGIHSPSEPRTQRAPSTSRAIRAPRTPRRTRVVRSPRSGRMSSNDSLELPSTRRGHNTRNSSQENSSAAPQQHSINTQPLTDFLFRQFGPITRRRSILGIIVSGTKRKVEECGEMSVNGLDESESSSFKRTRIDDQSAQIALPQITPMIENNEEAGGTTSSEVSTTAEDANLNKVPSALNEISIPRGLEIIDCSGITLPKTNIPNANMLVLTLKRDANKGNLNPNQIFKITRNGEMAAERSVETPVTIIDDNVNINNTEQNFRAPRSAELQSSHPRECVNKMPGKRNRQQNQTTEDSRHNSGHTIRPMETRRENNVGTIPPQHGESMEAARGNDQENEQREESEVSEAIKAIFSNINKCNLM